ncbi:unnamed protein product [Eruca vesicaria subsp. sativa]|uniref:Large ribosomal subunit protein eL20 domain-containing protein n=1 Tax=Eruca vesicaria subsp. sativa TaxID=29727 RepID=A0ABC8J355_ERUVS|nr:unnamed protein product [Eruca vesicaria subsp. sativa]
MYDPCGKCELYVLQCIDFISFCLFEQFHQYQVVGRALPTEKDVQPKIYRMKLWATNEVRAKSKFWYFLRKLKKVKKSNGQMLAINEIFEKNPTKIKNFGIWLRYQSRTGYHNMYKEFRDTTLNGAVEQMYTEMASRHRVRFPCIQIIKTATVPASLCKRESTKQFHNSEIKFPLVFRKVRPPTRKLKTTYKASKPNLFMHVNDSKNNVSLLDPRPVGITVSTYTEPGLFQKAEKSVTRHCKKHVVESTNGFFWILEANKSSSLHRLQS